MIITKTPFRMSFFGGGTDLKEFYEEYGGAVLSSTFDKYVYVTVRHLPRFFDYKNQLTYSKIGTIGSGSRIDNGLDVIVCFKAVKHDLEFFCHFVTAFWGIVIFSVKFKVNDGRQHIFYYRNGLNEIISLGIAAAVIAEKVIGTPPQRRFLHFFAVVFKISVGKGTALCRFDKGKINALFGKCLPVDFSLIGRYIHTSDGIFFFGGIYLHETVEKEYGRND